jgi:hypothetical protein
MSDSRRIINEALPLPTDWSDPVGGGRRATATRGAEASLTATETIGEAGGVLRAGSYILVIPPFALDEPVTLTARVASNGASVTLEPEGLALAVPACLVRGYGERAPQVCFLRVIPSGGAAMDLLDALPALDMRHDGKVFGSLRWCSSYMASE